MEFVKIREKNAVSSCEVAHRFTDTRAIVLFDGLYLMADRLSLDEWELSSEPARPGAELLTLNTLIARLVQEGTIVTVTKP